MMALWNAPLTENVQMSLEMVIATPILISFLLVSPDTSLPPRSVLGPDSFCSVLFWSVTVLCSLRCKSRLPLRLRPSSCMGYQSQENQSLQWKKPPNSPASPKVFPKVVAVHE